MYSWRSVLHQHQKVSQYFSSIRLSGTDQPEAHEIVDAESAPASRTVMDAASSQTPNLRRAQEKSAEDVIDLLNETTGAMLGMGTRGSAVEARQAVDRMGESQGEASEIEVRRGTEIAQSGPGNGPADASISAAGGHGRGEGMGENAATTGDRRGRALNDEGQQGAARKSKRVKTEPLEPIMPIGQSASVSEVHALS